MKLDKEMSNLVLSTIISAGMAGNILCVACKDNSTGEEMTVVCIQIGEKEDHITTIPVAVLLSHDMANRLETPFAEKIENPLKERFNQ